jgi:hypothetical protein
MNIILTVSAFIIGTLFALGAFFKDENDNINQQVTGEKE